MKLTLQNILHLYRFYNSFIYLFCKVYEFRAPIVWNKGHTVQYIQGELGVEDPFSIYIGDDQTNEDAFEVFFPLLLPPHLFFSWSSWGRGA